MDQTIIVGFILIAVSSTQSQYLCNDETDCRVHCPITHNGECQNSHCTCSTKLNIRCNDERDCAVHCPLTHKGECTASSRCDCSPIQGSFFCRNDDDCRVHCPFTHVGKCQNKDSNNQTCTCNFNPTIPCSTEFQCRVHCPLTHRGSCKSSLTCSCDPIPSWLLPSTGPASSTPPATTITATEYHCLTNIDCDVLCPQSHLGACQKDNTCACDPSMEGKPIRCHNTIDCIQHCPETHAGSCQSSSCRCLLASDRVMG